MDGLAEINGIKPNVFLAEGEEHEVGSATSKSKYKVKRTLDHYHCTCPAWRNQPGLPVNARTCKHLKAFLGDAYENARIALKNPDGPPPKGAKSAKPSKAVTTTSRVKPASKRKREADDEQDGTEAEGKPASPKKMGGRASKRTKTEQPSEEDVEMKPVSKEKTKSQTEGVNDGDELAEINGVKPLVVLQDGEATEVGSATSKSKYKVKRTFDHYYCSCPAWRNQARVPVNARSCKHLKSLLGEAYEEARLMFKQSGLSIGEHTAVSGATSKTKAKSSSRAKPISGVIQDPEARDAKLEDVDMDEGPAEGSEEHHAKDRREDEVKITDEEHDKDAEAVQATSRSSSDGVEAERDDELAEIDGVKPNVYMKDGEEREVGSMTSNAKYKVKRTWDHYYCSCPAWRNQGGVPVNARTCKHLKNLLGEAYESTRLLKKNPDGPQPTASPTKKARSKGKAAEPKSKTNGDGEDDEDAGTGGVPELLLANKWDLDHGPDPSGWWISEKLDGVRTYYDGTKMISRLGNPFTPPQWFLAKLPKDVTLDGELFAGRGKFQSTVSIVKTANSPHWKNITFQVFDVPSRGTEPFESRLEFIQSLFGPGGSHCSDYVVVVEQEKIRDRQHVLDKLKEVEGVGGEGVMLREPKSVYEGHRSSTLFKVKTFYDAEAIVTGYVEGKGKNKGVTGALQCKMESGKTFSVGSGLTDKQRKNPPAVGSIIIYRFQELTRDRVPRFPTFVGIAADKDRPKDAEIPEHKLQNGSSKGDA